MSVEVFQICLNLLTLGAFYGATKVELRWINDTLSRHEEKLDNLTEKNYATRKI